MALGALLWPLALRAQSGRTTIVVGVGDKETGQFLQGANVRIRGIYSGVFTDRMGQARLKDVEAGHYTLEVRRIGYEPITAPIAVANQDSLEVVVLMRAAPQQLSTVTVTESAVPARLREFEERRRRGTGRYVTGAQIDDMYGATLNSILLRHVPGARIAFASDGLEGKDIAISTRGYNGIGGPCQAVTFLDGVMISDGDISFVDPSQLGGIEWYTPGTIPVQFQVANVSGGMMPTGGGAPAGGARASFGNSSGGTPGRPQAGSAGCGVLLLWTKP
jgi:hypothetical protein